MNTDPIPATPMHPGADSPQHKVRRILQALVLQSMG
jgi:hypothetical protein